MIYGLRRIGRRVKQYTRVIYGSRTKKGDTISSTERSCRRFSLAEIHSATENFSEACLIGHGGFGNVYKGKIDDGDVAIKRRGQKSRQGKVNFLTEIETLSKLKHINIVSLIGYCSDNGEMILVYEYIPNGTLAAHLYRPSGRSESDENWSSLTWHQRLNICIEVGQCIDSIHTKSSIIHRDIKTTNVLLDENFTAKVSDFGLAKHFKATCRKSHVSTEVKGSFGYMDPTYFNSQRLTMKSDTYSFGVLLLEVLCGRPAVDNNLKEDEESLSMWALEQISNGNVDRILHDDLRGKISAVCVKTFVGIIMRCLERDPKKRPTMRQVVVQLKLALKQQGGPAPTPNASQIGSSASESTQEEEEEEEEEELMDEQTLIAVPAIPIHALKHIIDNSVCYSGMIYTGTLKSGFFSCNSKGSSASESTQEEEEEELMDEQTLVAIKSLCYRYLTLKEFLKQVSLLSSLKHENVAQLLGYCVDGVQQYLAYEFAHNASLEDILQGINGSKAVVALSWDERVKIAIGVAQGLEYIHEKTHIRYDIKLSNILLYNDGVVKLDGLGLLDHFGHDCPYDYGDYHPSALTHPHDYQPPEYLMRGEISSKSDVYSFGLVLLQILTGRKLVDHTRHLHLLEWATPLIGKDKVNEIVDARLNGHYPPEAVAKMAAVAVRCVQGEAKLRPEKSEVVMLLHHL